MPFPARIIGGVNPYSWQRLRFTPDGQLEDAEETGELNAFDPQNRLSITAPMVWLVARSKESGKVLNYWIVG